MNEDKEIFHQETFNSDPTQIIRKADTLINTHSLSIPES